MSKQNECRKLPILYENKADCCSCGACAAICPSGAISMIIDKEGFIYPNVDENRCIRCYLCVKKCPIKEDNQDGHW